MYLIYWHKKLVEPGARELVERFHKGEKEKATILMTSFETERENLFTALDELYLA